MEGAIHNNVVKYSKIPRRIATYGLSCYVEPGADMDAYFSEVS